MAISKLKRVPNIILSGYISLATSIGMVLSCVDVVH